MKAHRLVVLAAAGVSVLVLSGCSQSLGGDVAATVDGHTISNADVKFLARLQCDAINAASKDPAQAGNVQTVSRKQIRTDMLNALVQSRLNRELGKEQGVTYDRATYRQVMDQFEQQAVQAAPEKDQARFRSMIGKLYQGQLEVYAIAARELGAQGVDKPTQQQVDALVTKIEDDYRKQADVKIDPIYGARKGVAGAADTSLSKPVSAFAKASVASPQDAAWASKLPANQKCG